MRLRLRRVVLIGSGRRCEVGDEQRRTERTGRRLQRATCIDLAAVGDHGIEPQLGA
ncbi:hypothetical protein [Aeromicrobium sp. UC242_57]|uniref:hypothetical protein n=1 Tax=Aeromicrobium sp. UC242_57 TaxID=3374624 RepID=UPI0037BD33AE